MRKRNFLLDYLRATACIMVVLYHYTFRYEEFFHNTPAWGVRLPWGWMAVSVFFMLSGYLAIANEKQYSNLGGYIQEKVVRLYPAYWVSMLITFVVTSLYLPSKAVSLWEFLFNLTMLESFVGVSLVDGAYWTLANELVFYAFFAIVVILLKKRDEFQWFTLAWVLLLIVYRYVEREGLIFAAIGKLMARPYGHMFVTGSSLYYVFKKEGSFSSRVLSIITIMLSMLYHYFVFNLDYCIFFYVSIVIIGICVFLGNNDFSISKKDVSCLRPLRTVAAISYPLYLIHQFVGYAILNGMISIGFHSEIIILVPICLTGCLAYFIHRFVETPASKWFAKKRVLRKDLS